MTASKKDTLDDCIKALQSDAVIMTLNIGTGSDAFSVKVQQSVLEATSDYFRSALRKDTFREGQSKVISFEDDDVDAWKVLLYWILHRGLPDNMGEESNMELAIALVKCWILGNKYFVRGFQDDIMLELLWFLEEVEIATNPGELAQWVPTIHGVPAGSKLMKLVAEEFAHSYHRKSFTWEHLELLDGILGFWPEFVRARDMLAGNSKALMGRTHGVNKTEDRAHWRDYMIGKNSRITEILNDK